MFFKQSKLTLTSLTILPISLLLIFLAKPAINDLAFRILLNTSFASVDALNLFTFSFASLGYGLMFLGAVLFAFIG
ncbi:MAG: hypothetical protein WC325_12150, partial [Candidatus Bathyarchaeia archaeon]